MDDPREERDPLEALASEFMARQRRGEAPSVEEYAAKYPELAADIRELFPTIAATERLKAREAQQAGGRATLGGVRLERLGDFRIVREIGRGGMGIVYEAEQESLGRRVAIKVLPRTALLDGRQLQRFRREARIAANLHHTNIVEVFGAGEQEGFHYFVMQCIDGEGLDAMIRRLRDGAGQREWRRVAEIGRQAADALAYAHSQGTLHRDVKPANLLLDAQGTVWVTDFGLAKAAHSENVTQTGDVAGTLRYMAPEQFEGQADARSDLYSLGLTLYELLALQAAYGDAERSTLIRRITEGRPTPLHRLAPGIPRDLETIVLKAIARDPEHRYASADALAADLRCFLEDRPIRARRASSLERAWRWCRRNRGVAALAATTLALLVLVAGVATVGYVHTRRALDGEERERAKAEANAQVAMEALDRIFERFSPSRVVSSPELTVEGADGASVDVPSPPVLSREAAALLDSMLAFYDRLAQQAGDDDRLRAKAAEANRRVGDIRQRLGQYGQAATAYQRAIAIYEELTARSPHDTRFPLAIASVHNELGRLYRATRKPAESRQAHLKARAILDSAASGSPAPAEVRFELARTGYFLGTRPGPPPAPRPRGPERGPRPGRRPWAERRRPPQEHPSPPGDGAAARDARKQQRDALAEAATLLEGLVAEHPAEPSYQHMLALCYRDGPSRPRADSPDADPREQAITILERLAANHPDVPDYRYDLAEAYAKGHPGPPGSRPGDTDAKGEERLRKALEITEKLAADNPYIPAYLAAQTHTLHKLGATLRQAGRLDEAEQSLARAVAIQSRLVEQLPDAAGHKVWLGVLRISNADLLVRRGKLQDAEAALDATAELLAQVHEDMPETRFVAWLLQRTRDNLARARRRPGTPGEPPVPAPDDR